MTADVVHAKSLSLLGIQTVRGLTGSRLGEAFRACALAWHPDRHAGLSLFHAPHFSLIII